MAASTGNRLLPIIQGLGCSPGTTPHRRFTGNERRIDTPLIIILLQGHVSSRRDPRRRPAAGTDTRRAPSEGNLAIIILVVRQALSVVYSSPGAETARGGVDRICGAIT